MQEIVEPLLNWYQKTERPLPWRIDKDPYHIWVSEIMLQQTRIEAVKEYYYHFMKRLPTIQDLAQIPEDELLKLWQGLGYYNRARNLKKTAQIIVEQYNGLFPQNYQELKKLPGIGEYTAGAIASICFNLKEVAIDGNVLRVITRLQNSYDCIDEKPTKKKIETQIRNILPNQSGKFNQAIMELGETICTPTQNPKCQICPIHSFCIAKQNKTYQELPKKNPKRSKKEEDYTVFLYIYKNEIAIQKRNDQGLLKNMWEFPNKIGKLNIEDCKKWWLEQNQKPSEYHSSISYKHIFTHKIWNIQTYLVKTEKKYPQFTWITIDELAKKYALPTAFQPCFVEIKKNLEKNKTVHTICG